MVTVLGANSVTGGYQVDNSLRFERASNDALNITPSNVSSRKTFTVSAWIKKVDLTSNTTTAIISARVDGSNNFDLSFEDDFQLRCKIEISDNNYFLRSTALYRDLSAWHHVVLAVDTTQSTDTNRVKLYVNGVILSSFATSTFPGQNADTSFNNTNLHQIGGTGGGGQTSMYLSEMVVIDGQALDPTSFGEFDEDSGIWKPIKVSGLTFGTNGFYLEFKQAGTGTNASGMGADTSGNNNHLAVANLTAVDQSTDTCTTNFAVMNPLDNFYAGGTFAEGNLQVTSRNTGYSYNTSTFGLATGKWYWEVKWSAQNTGSTNQVQIGIAKRVSASSTTWLGSVAYTYGYQGASGHVQNNDGNASGSVATTYSVGDIISVAMDLDNNKIHFAKNGTYTNSSNPATNSGGVTITAPDSTSEDSGFYFPAFGDGNNNLVETGQFNFGSPPYAISSGNQDADGFGNFEYAVPSGYFAINTKNLAEYG